MLTRPRPVTLHGGVSRPPQEASSLEGELSGLSRQVNRLGAILDRIADGVVVLGPEGEVRFTNPAAAALLSASGGELPFPIAPGEQLDATLQLLGGREVHLEVKGVEAEWDGGPACLVLLRDISRRHEAEAAMTRLNAELARSNTDLESFASFIAHELKQPLSSINRQLHLVQRRLAGVDPGATQLLDASISALSDLSQLVGTLLGYSRAAQAPVKATEVDCARVVRRCLATAADLPGRVKVGPLPVVRADEHMVRLVFQNLILNALRHCRTGVEPEVEVGSERTARGWRFTVSDNGPGIPADHRSRVFDPFWRPEGSDDAGYGIGLAVSARAVARLGGEIWVEEPNGGGSRLCFTLPQ